MEDKKNDSELIASYLSGDEAALQALFERYLKPVYGFVYRYVGNAGDAEDITQDAFVNAWKNLKKFDRSRNFKTWLFAIAKNAALNWLKKKKPALFSEFEKEDGGNLLAETLADPAPLPEKIFADKELGRKLAAAMEGLKPDYRTVLLLYYNDHLTFEEIGEAVGKPLNTVKSQHRRALIALRTQIANPIV